MTAVNKTGNERCIHAAKVSMHIHETGVSKGSTPAQGNWLQAHPGVHLQADWYMGRVNHCNSTLYHRIIGSNYFTITGSRANEKYEHQDQPQLFYIYYWKTTLLSNPTLATSYKQGYGICPHNAQHTQNFSISCVKLTLAVPYKKACHDDYHTVITSEPHKCHDYV